MSKEFWTYENWNNGELVDHEFATMQEADSAADEAFAEEMYSNCEPRDGENFSERITLIKYKLDSHDNYVVLERVKSIVEYTHYQGDFSEHFNQSDYI